MAMQVDNLLPMKMGAESSRRHDAVAADFPTSDFNIRPGNSRFKVLGLLLAGGLAGTSLVSGADVLPDIPRGTIALQLTAVATGLGAPDYAISAPGDASRLFVLEQKGLVLIMKNGALLATPALDIQSLMTGSFNPSTANDERGLLGIAFHPGFNTPASPGYHTLYTYNSQPIGTTAPTYPAPNVGTQSYKNVVNEWKLNSTNPDIIDPLTRREVISFGKATGANNHNGGTVAFGPDGYLYLGLGDGGNANDFGASHIEPGGNAQNLTTPLGKMLRFDPLDPSLTSGSADPISGNGRYRIPTTNPFQGVGQIPEIYAYGFRNPYRFSFDRLNGQLIVADVGQNNIEEIDRVTLGGNYGWAVKEGDFLFNRLSGPGVSAGSVGVRSPGSPSGLIDPITGTLGTLEYDHGDGISIIGGFVYRGSLMPELYGKYVFGDLALHNNMQRADGRLFYADLDTGLIKEFLLPQFVTTYLPNGLTVHGFGEDSNGELYALVTNTPANGSGGIIYSLKSAPVIWSGAAITFSKTAGADWTMAQNQDRITDAVWLTRAGSQGIFNIKSETLFSHLVSPARTEWATGTTANYATLTYTNWETWTGGSGGGPPGKVGENAVLHLLDGNIYIDIKFTAWGASGSGGAFSYLRSTSPLEAWRQQYFGIPTNTGNAADSFDFDNDGLVNIVEYAFGLNPVSGSSAALPQPQLLAGVFGVSFTQPSGVSGITYKAEWSNSLASGSWAAIADTGTGATHTFNLPAGTDPRVFFRYIVTVP